MGNILASMVAVASGSSTQVKHWSNLLQASRVPFTVAKYDGDAGIAKSDYAELWVSRDDVTRARSAILTSIEPDLALFW